MVFLSPWFLVALGGVAVPVIIHLIHRRKVRQVRFSSVMLLDEIVRRYRSRHRIQEWLVLCLRCFAVGAVALGLARPALRSSAPLGPDCACAILLDDTYSMAARDGGQSRFERAVAYAKEVLSVMTRRDRLALIRLSTPKNTQTSADPTALINNLEKTHPLSDRADLKAAIKSALAFFQSAKTSSRLLVILGDRQTRTYKALNERPIRDTLRREKVYILFIDCSKTTPPNAAVTSLTLRRNPKNPHNLILTATTKNLHKKALNLRPEVAIRSRKTVLPPLKIRANSTETIMAQIPSRLVLQPSAAQLRIEGDGLDTDNTFHFIAALPTKIPVLIVNGDPSPLPELDECFYLRHAVAPRDPQTGLALSDFEPEVTDLWGLRTKEFKNYGAIVLANVRKLDAALARKLAQFLAEGGGVMLFFGERADVEWWDGFLRGLCRIGVKQKRSFGEPARMGRILWEHPLFEIFSDLGDEAFSTLRVRRAVVLDAADGVLARLDDGTPFVVEARASEGRILIVATTADRDWSNFPLRPAFLPFLHMGLSHIAKKPPSPQRLVGQAISVKLPSSDAVLIAPSGRLSHLKADERGYITFLPDEAGVWRLKSGGKEFLFAANLRREESDLARVHVAGFGNGTILRCPRGLGATIERMRSGVKLWGALFLLAAAALLLELLLANRRLPGVER